VSKENHSFGGQAVIEGVMMRGKRSWAVAVRRPAGDIAVESFLLPPASERHALLKLPIVRGVAALYESLALGIKALGISANIGLQEATAQTTSPAGAASAQQIEEDANTQTRGSAKQRGGKKAAEQAPAQEFNFGFKELAGTVVLSLVLAVALFVVIPLLVVKHYQSTFHNPFLFNLIEGLIRIGIFLLYIFGISFIRDLRRVFEYHGAEHKIIHTYEAGEPLDAEHAAKYHTMHPRCGTGFLLLVMVVAVFLFALVGKPPLPYLVLSRIIGIPVIVGISYELGIRGAGRHAKNLASRMLLWPGMQLQRLTTREPTADQIEVAAASLEEVLKLDGAPMPVPAATVAAMS
jgi:uncharacterized protein YqhQ